MSYKTTIQNIPSNGLFHRVEQSVPWGGTKCSMGWNKVFHGVEHLHTLILMLLMLVLGSEMAWGQATYTYYAFHNKDKGYMKQCKGIVFNDNTFRYENAYDGNGSSIWILSSDGYLQQEMYYLNVANDKTLYLSTTPITTWNLVDADGKKRIQMRGSTKILGYNSGSYPVLADNPTYKYAACTLTVTEEGGKWEGPKDIDITVQSPQLLSYLRTYYLRNITVTIGKNDAGTENAKVVDKKDSRCYCMRTYKATSDANKGTKWDYDTDTKVIYNLTTTDQAVTATYDIAPLDPIARNAHPATEKSSKVTIKPKAFTPNTTKKYLLFNIQEEDYRFPKATSSLSEGDMLPVDGKKSELTEAINGDLSWDVEVDAEGYYSFKNVTTGRYIYYDADDYTKSDYGVVKIGATELPSDDTRYKFRIFNCGNLDPFGACNYIIPFDKQFAVYNNSGAIEEIFFAIYPNTSSKIGSISKVSNNIKWKFYSYEWQYRLWSDYTISGEQEVYTSGNHDYTATTWFSRNIKDSPNNSDYCTQPGYKTQTGITYTWQLTGLDDYVTTSDELSSGTSTLTANVTLPPGTRTGTLKVTAKITSPANLTNNTSIPIALYNLSPTFTEIGSLSQITDASGLYKLTGNNTYSSDNKPAVTTFSGTLDGGNYTISGLSAPLFQTIDGGTVRNLMVDCITITSGNSNGDVGAICCEAKGNARIYNCGVLTSRSTVTSDDDGYTKITSNSSTISGSRYVGGLVGLLDESARVINCFSYANITGGTNVGGIVGYNNYATTSVNAMTMVMNCMFYGDITGGTNKAPIYNGNIITNRGDQNGVSNYNYFWGGASYVQNRRIDTYNCALMAETRFLQRFEFFRHLLNSHRELAAWWATGSMANKDQMMKWVLEPSQIGSTTPYPILKAPKDQNGKVIQYPSVVNIDAKNATTQTERNKGGKLGELSVTIQMGSGGAVYEPPTGAEIIESKSSLTLNITDKDPDHFNFNYYKVQLPYYNDVGTKNYTGYRVVTGWKIVSITGGTAGTFSTGTDATTDAEGKITAAPYNFADRNCTAKDLYSSTNKRVFNQGAYWDVPEGVTAITIEPYWAKAAYLADANADVVYNTGMDTPYNVPNIGGGELYKNKQSYSIAGVDQVVYTSSDDARDNLSLNSSHTVYDHAIVLVGNFHKHNGVTSSNAGHPYTIMSADFDGDNEPDYSYILRFNGRNSTHPVRVDFLNIPGPGMAQKSTGGTGTYNFGIIQPIGWFESTNTSLFRVTQFEYDNKDRVAAPLILQGGVMEQWVSGQDNGAANNTTYFHVGGNVWFKEFHRGTHIDKTLTSTHPPLSVTGGDYDEFYLTGLYKAVTKTNDNAECYINGGRFGIVAGTGMEGIGDDNNNANTKGNIIWQIQNADIDEFYGGGINAASCIGGNITTVITGSRVRQFCGGPKFGDLYSGRTVITTATDCEFGTYFGAGYGGNSYSTFPPKNVTGTNGDYGENNWNKFVTDNYKQEYKVSNSPAYKGVSTEFYYQYLPQSNNTQNVARIFVNFVIFSLATTHNVTSKLNGCTIKQNFYGGGSLGKVNGPVTSTLNNCTVEGSVFGAGYSASLPTVEVMNTGGFAKAPFYDANLGAYFEPTYPATVTYNWQHAAEVNSTETAIDKTNHILYTTEDLTALGTVTGDVTLSINGTTTVAGSVYGGGEESNVSGSTAVNISGGTVVHDVFGGGKGVADEFACSKAMIGIDGEGANNENPEATKDKGTIVNISDGTVNGNVYGGGEVGRVEWNTQVKIGEDGTGEPVIMGNVFGAGKGLKTHGYAALVRGNPTVTIQGNAKIKKSVYGGGEIASVARYKVASTAEEAAEHGVEIGMPYALANNYSGNCKVIVGGYAIIGPDEPMKMYHPEITDGTDKPDDFGHVFAAGKGVLPEVYTYEDNEHRPKRMLLYNEDSHPDEGYWEWADEAHINIWEYFEDEEAYFAFIKTLALSSKTEVTIKDNAFVKGSVYGGSENGLVQFDTDVKIQGGQIGCGKDTTEPYGDEVWANDYTPSGDLECASWSYEAPYAPYDPNANATGDLDKYSSGKSTEGGRRIATDGHTYYGNVFGGGSGSVPYFDTEKGVSRYVSSAGMVKGNTKVTISGGHILTNVYGGCEATNVLGSATITMTGGTVGVPRTLEQIVAHPLTCYIFGAGKGDQRIFFNKETNVDRTTVSIEGGKVYGSVFGGGEDGHVFQNTTVNIGTTEGEGPTIGTLGTSYVDGNVFGGGRGFGGEALTAGNIGGSVELNVKSGKILGSVYGGGRLASVGYGLYLVDEEIEEGGETIKPYGILRPDDKYDGSYPDPSTDPASTYYNKGRGYITINISGGTIGNDLEYIYNPTAGQKAAIPNTTFDYQNHLQYTKGGNVFTGGMGRLYALDGTTLLPIWSKLGKCKGTTLNMTGGIVKSSIYGGGEIGAVAENATVNIKGGTVGTKVVDSEDATKYYYFGSVFGGGKGSVDNITYPSTTPEEEQIPISEAGTTGGNVEVHLNKDVAEDAKGAVVSQVFGCNDMNGSPKGTVTVHVYATQTAGNDNISSKPTKDTDTYDVMAVYGGGNLATYEPTDLTTGKTNVIIEGCGLTSIRQVYGGGNAASTPATDVEINGTYEIAEVFGGGNGLDALPNGRPNPGANVGYKNYTIYEQDGDVWKAKDDPDYDTKEERTAEGSSIVYGTGAANVNINGGTIHRVFGGSNTKGNVRITAVTMLEEAGGCPFCVDEAYGGGKSAPMDAEAKLLMSCIPGLNVAYGGAEAADIQGNVILNITNGKFDRVFGGNNKSGTIRGSITVNIEETGCKPIIIGELYGGGNLASYSIYGYKEVIEDNKKVWKPRESESDEGTGPIHNYADPQINVKSFTSIGDIYGGGLGESALMVGSPTVNINVANGKFYNNDDAVVAEGTKTPGNYPIPSHAKGKIGAINNVFGGGNAAKVIGNTNVDIGTQSEVYVIKSVAVGDPVTDYFIRNFDGTYSAATGTAVEGTTYYEKKDVIGADIRGNVYGGGNNAEVTGDTNVVIGKKKE